MIKKPKKVRVSDQVLDILVRRYVKLMADGHCKRCGKYVGVENLAAAHLFNRWRKTVRWDLRNVWAICDNPPIGMKCHMIIDNNPLAKASLMHEILTPEEITDLEKLAMLTLKEHPIDKYELKQELKEKIKLLEDS